MAHNFGRSHGIKRKATGMARIDQLVSHGGRFRQNTEPAERIDALVDFQQISRNGLARDAVKAITAGNEIAVHLMRLAVLLIGQARLVGFDVMNGDIVAIKTQIAACGDTRIDQVFGDFRLAIDDNMLVARELFKIDLEALVFNRNIAALMHHAFARATLADTGFIQEINCALLQHARANTPLDIGAVFALQNDAGDSRLVEQLC